MGCAPADIAGSPGAAYAAHQPPKGLLLSRLASGVWTGSATLISVPLRDGNGLGIARLLVELTAACPKRLRPGSPAVLRYSRPQSATVGSSDPLLPADQLGLL